MGEFEMKMLSVTGEKFVAKQINDGVKAVALSTPFLKSQVEQTAYMITVTLTTNPVAVIELTRKYLELKFSLNAERFHF